MNLQLLAESKIVEDLGRTLIHSFWQIGLAAGALLVVLRLVRPNAAKLRYGLCIFALIAALTLPVVTFFQISNGTTRGSFFDKVAQRPDFENDLRARGLNLDQSEAVADVRSAGKTETTKAPERFSAVREFFDRYSSLIMQLTVTLWLLGVVFFSFRLCGGIWQLRRYKTDAVEPVDEHWKRVFVELCEKLGIDRQVELLRSTIVETPIAIGFFRPLIIIPASAFLQISPAELETIIAHELIHIQRFDPFVNIMQSVIETLLFYHPGIWWISKQIRLEREFAADGAVMEIFGSSHIVYANALANLEEIRSRASHGMPPVATAANGGNLMQRIQRILKIKTEMTHARSAWPAGLAFVLISAVLTMVFSFNSPSFVNAQSKASSRKLAIGFVSMPPLDRSDNPPKESDATARLLIAKLAQYKIPAIGFVNGSSISDGRKSYPVRANIVRMWRDAGLEIGIGGYNHIWFADTPYDEYTANVEKNQKITEGILGEKNLKLRYYSYPYLNTGKTDADHQAFESWLDSRGLRSVKYTIDNNEWMYSYAYDMARQDNDLNTQREIRESFVKYMSKMFDHYETYSKQMFGRDIPQTMVLTSSRLVTDSADELFTMIDKRGYSYVSMDEAQSDEAYKSEEHFAGHSGISWFERWTMHQNKPLLDEPKVTKVVWDIWETRGKK